MSEIHKPNNLADADRDQLIHRIDELETLLTRKKAEAQKMDNPRLKFGTDGIPVLIDAVNDTDFEENGDLFAGQANPEDDVIGDIIKLVYEEITQDIDELIVTLQDSIIEEVKTRLLEKLQTKAMYKQGKHET